MINLTGAYDKAPTITQNVSSVIAEETFSGITMENDSMSLSATEDTTERIIGENNLFFNIAVRGVLYCAVNVIATILNTSTIVVTYKYRKLQISSNALLVCFCASQWEILWQGSLGLCHSSRPLFLKIQNSHGKLLVSFRHFSHYGNNL